MPSFLHTIDIDATPEQVWAVLGDIGAVDRWIPGVTSVAVDGMTRVCTFEDGHTQDERILEYSPDTRSYRYHIEGAPLPVTDNTGRFSIDANGGQSRVMWESSFEPLDPVMAAQLAEMWEPYLPMTLANLKRLVEESVAKPT
ncbi:MAG: SRPBCC family protein [Actinobacteria bacterium]|nr:SRPBCC family protein [Actinomycetota bacterium]